MDNEVKRREPGKRVFPSNNHPKLVLVPAPREPDLPHVNTDLSREVKEVLREVNGKQAATRITNAPDPA
ncbi:MAG: hypothetical protein H0T92_19095 [Pyrinomonadaceae bacterium]|nr:hypothetical protein [Pyrinomonadaceae bacterium]